MSAINKKLKLVREAILKCDWTTDKFYQLPGKNGRFTDVHYVTLPKITRNTNMVFLQYNMDLKVNMLSMVDSERECRLSADVILTDLDSDEQDVTHIIASAPLSDKDSSVALAYVRRQYFASRFGIVDGLNFDEGQEENTLTNLLYSKAVEPVNAVPAEPVPKAVASKPTPMIPLDKLKEKSAPKKADSPAPTAPTAPPKTNTLSFMEERGCVKTMEYIEANKTLIDEEVYTKAKNIFDNRSSSSDVLALMEIKRSIDSKKAPVQEGM